MRIKSNRIHLKWFSLNHLHAITFKDRSTSSQIRQIEVLLIAITSNSTSKVFLKQTFLALAFVLKLIPNACLASWASTLSWKLIWKLLKSLGRNINSKQLDYLKFPSSFIVDWFQASRFSFLRLILLIYFFSLIQYISG